MRTAFPRRSLILLGIALLVPCLLGTTYKWADAQGQVHFTDTPPPAGVPFETVAAPHPPAPPPAAPRLTIAPATETPVSAVAPPPTQDSGAAVGVLDDGRCVDALYQLQLLVGKYKVYQGPDDARRYLDDAERPAEIARLTRERDESCSQDPPLQGSQQRRAAQLFQTLHPDCREAREKLANLLRTTARSSPGDIAEQREYITKFCPGIPGVDSRIDLWRADWVWQWHRD